MNKKINITTKVDCMEINFSGLEQKNKVENEIEQVIVLGSGPAGFSAALYAARAELNPLVFTGIELGGQAALTYLIENYPGFPEGVSGSQLGELFQKQAEKFGARVEFETVTEVDFSQHPLVVKTYGKDFLTESVIISTGASALHLNIPGEKELIGRGVSYCATCDGWFFKGKHVMVVGGGDSAVEEALFLTRYAESVTIVHRRSELRAGILLQKRARENPKIKFLWNSVLAEIQGTDAVKSVVVNNLVTGEASTVKMDGVFIFIGHKPNTELFEGQVEMDDKGYIVIDHEMQTNIPGVFAAGEAADPNFRQVITSAGMGAAAGIMVSKYLEEEKTKEGSVAVQE
jgi:thioredoxin reductase (NADPH)